MFNYLERLSPKALFKRMLCRSPQSSLADGCGFSKSTSYSAGQLPVTASTPSDHSTRLVCTSGWGQSGLSGLSLPALLENSLLWRQETTLGWGEGETKKMKGEEEDEKEKGKREKGEEREQERERKKEGREGRKN